MGRPIAISYTLVETKDSYQNLKISKSGTSAATSILVVPYDYILVDLEIFWQIPGLRKLLFWGGGVTTYRGEKIWLHGIPVLRYNIDASTFTVVTSPRIRSVRVRVRFSGAAAAAAFFCISYRGKLLHHKLIDVQCTKKSTRTKAVFSGTKSPPIEGRCALAHCPDTGNAHVYSHDCAGTPHRAPCSIRM
jgi:hypothetical protein